MPHITDEELVSEHVKPVAVHIVGGLLHAWQLRNSAATVPHTIEQLRAAGNVDNLSRLLVDDPPPYRGPLPVPRHRPVQDPRRAGVRDRRRAPRPEPRTGVLRRGRRAAGAGAGRGRLPELLLPGPGARQEAVGGPRLGPRALQPGPPHPGRGRRAPADGRRAAARGGGAFADLVVARFGPGSEEAICGHPEVEMALVELFRETGDRAYLVQARPVRGPARPGHLKHRIFPPDVLPGPPALPRPALGHRARRTDGLPRRGRDRRLPGDRRPPLFEALERLWDDMVATKLLHHRRARQPPLRRGDRRPLRAAVGARLRRDLRGHRHHAVGVADVPGDRGAKYLDVFERVLFNAYAVGLSADGTAFFYDNPLQRRPDHEQRSGAETGGEPLRRPGSAVPAARRTSSAGWRSSATTSPPNATGALLITAYAGARIETGPLALAMETGLPVGRRRAPRRRPGARRAVRDHAARAGLGEAR